MESKINIPLQVAMEEEDPNITLLHQKKSRTKQCRRFILIFIFSLVVYIYHLSFSYHYAVNGFGMTLEDHLSDPSSVKSAQVSVLRPALTVPTRLVDYAYHPSESKGFSSRIKKSITSSCNCSSICLKNFIFTRLPCLKWMLNYNKDWLVGDIVAGITVAVMHIPQGMGFALLADVPAICGIYMAFFQVLVYAFFGTGMHLSMGSFAVITLMTGKVVNQLATFPLDDQTGLNATDTLMDIDVNATSYEGYTPVQIATIVCFMSGIWNMIFGVLRLGSLSVFLSDMLVSGFTTAAAFHVLTSQVKDLLGLTVKGYSGPFKIIYTYVDIFSQLSNVNLIALAISATTITLLVLNNEVLKPILSRYSKVPLPIELIIVVLGTTISYLISLNEEHKVKIIGFIPSGLPYPEVPPLELLGKVALDSFVITIVAYTVSFSLAKIFAKRHNYEVDATQEFYAIGLTNISSSFFACPPTAVSLARALIQESVGGVTQFASLICCVIILLVLLFFGPLLESLPNSALASIIVVALKGMFLQVRDMTSMWKISRKDALIWIITFLSVVIIDIDFGLLIGVLVSLLVLLVNNQSPSFARIGRVSESDIYLDMKKYERAVDIPGMRIFRIIGSIHFANRESVKNQLIKMTELVPNSTTENKNKDGLEMDHENGIDDLKKVKWLVLDVTGISSIDSSGAKFIAQLRREYQQSQINICLAGIPEHVYFCLKKCEALNDFPSEHLFHSVHDAVTTLTKVNEEDYTKL